MGLQQCADEHHHGSAHRSRVPLPCRECSSITVLIYKAPFYLEFPIQSTVLVIELFTKYFEVHVYMIVQNLEYDEDAVFPPAAPPPFASELCR